MIKHYELIRPLLGMPLFIYIHSHDIIKKVSQTIYPWIIYWQVLSADFLTKMIMSHKVMGEEVLPSSILSGFVNILDLVCWSP